MPASTQEVSCIVERSSIQVLDHLGKDEDVIHVNGHEPLINEVLT